jgi:hypothetical protein
MMRRSLGLWALAGAAGPVLVAASLAGLSVIEWDFLRDSRWSAIRRTGVEWPSLLMLGSYGWVLVATLILAGLCGIALSAVLWQLDDSRGSRVAAVLLGLLSVAIALEALKPDSPVRTGNQVSWHDVIHNAVFPFIPACGVAASATSACTAARQRRDLVRPTHTLALLALMVTGLALTEIAAIAQLGRYFFFGALLVWIELLALGAVECTTQSRLGRT